MDAACYPLRGASTHYLKRLGEEVEARDFLKTVDLSQVRIGLFKSSKGVKGWRHEDLLSFLL
ncbi:MAG: hypothetical protein ACE5KV_09525 [Thermoplasmata archaeon]